MGKKYTINKKKCYNEDRMKLGVLKVVNEGKSIRNTANLLNLKKSTLQNYVKRYVSMQLDERETFKFAPSLKWKQVFSDSEEDLLKKYIVNEIRTSSDKSRTNQKRLAYKFASANNIKCPDPWHKNQTAGKDWLRHFYKRHPDLIWQINNPLSEMKKFQNPEQQMKNALLAVSQGQSLEQASKIYNIPYNILHSKVNNKIPKARNKNILSSHEEQSLVQWMLKTDAAGFSISNSQLLDSVHKIIKDRELSIPATDEQFWQDWYQSLIKRFPSLAERASLNPFPRSDHPEYTESNIQDWFENMHKHLEGLSMLDILHNENRIFVCEEFSIFLNLEDKLKVIVKREDAVQNLGDRERMSTVLLANAVGTLAPPLVVSKSQRLSKLMKDSIPLGWEVARSESGWATSDNFLDYIVKVFYPWLMSEQVKLPIILFLDATASPLTFSLSELCQRYGVLLVALYPNNNFVPRPLDVAFYDSLREKWKSLVVKSGKSKGIRKEDFCPLFRNVLEEIEARDLIVRGFEVCGLFPFMPVRTHFVEVQQKAQVNEEERIRKEALLKGIEEMIEDKLDLFRECRGKWEGRVEDTSLYILWRRLRIECGEDVQIKVEGDEDFDLDMNIVKRERD